MACSEGHISIIHRLLDAKADFDKPNMVFILQFSVLAHIAKAGDTPLHAACWGRHDEAVGVLIAAGASVNCRNGVCIEFLFAQ